MEEKNWTSLKGAPGGDDYHRIWINPLQPEIMLFAADQGAVVTVNNGKNMEFMVQSAHRTIVPC